MSEKITLSLIGGFLAGIAASLCCVAPLLLLLLGFGGAWVSNLTAIEPYRPILIVIAVFSLVIAYFQIYLPVEEPCCDIAKVCTNPSTQRLYKNLFLAVVVIVIASIAAPSIIVFIYG